MDTTTINKSIIMQPNVDTNNNPFVAIIPQIDRVTKCLTIVTNQVINEDGGVEILSPSNLIQVYNEADLINYDNRYMVLEDRAQIKFSENLEGQYIFFKHYGDGVIYMSANRIFTKLDSNGNIIETLDEIIEAVRKGIELFKTAEDLKKISVDMNISLENAQIIITDLNNGVVIANQTNNTLTTTTNNAKAEDVIVNKTIDTAKVIDKTLNDTNTTANNTNTTLNGTIVTGNQLKSDLTTLNTKSLETKGLLDISKANADVLKLALDTSKDNADASKLALDTANDDATKIKNDLDTLNTNATKTKDDITAINTTATQTIANLTTINADAIKNKDSLTAINSTAVTTTNTLQTGIYDANTANANLQASIASSNISGMKSSIDGIINGTTNITYSDLATTNKTIKGAIGEIRGQVGDMSTVNTNAKTCAGAIIEMNAKVSVLASGNNGTFYWTKLHDGTIIQYGRGAGYQAGNEYDVIFPVAFPNKCYFAIAETISRDDISIAYTEYVNVRTSNVDKTKLHLKVGEPITGAQSMTFNIGWVAVGR